MNDCPVSFCAIDFETACPARASACAIALVRVREGSIVDHYYSLIRPPEGMEILPWFTDIHGITMQDVCDAPSFLCLWADISSFIGCDFLVAHNASFDRSVLKASLDYFSIDAVMPHFECSVDWSRRAWAFLENHKLNTVSTYLGIELNHHQALSDAMACAQIYVKARKAAENASGGR